MRIKRRVQDVPGGAAMGGLPVRLRRHADDAVVATAQTDAAGWFDVQADGHPGPFYAEVDGPGGSQRATSARVGGMVGGFSLLEIPDALRAFGDGVVTKAGALTATVGVGQVTVSPHLALVRGVPCRLYSPRAFDVAPGTRTDRVVWRVRTSGEEAGRADLAYLEGTAPTRTADLWEEPLVEVAVAGSAVSAAVVARGVPTHRKTETAIARSSAQAAPASTTAEAVAAFDATLTLPDAAVYDVLASFGGIASGEIDVAVRVNSDTGTYRTGSAAESLFTARNAHARSGANGVQGPASVPVQVVVKRSASYVGEHTEVTSTPTEVAVTTFEHVRTIGGSGSGNGQLDGPRDVAIGNGFLLVADSNNDRAHLFDPATGSYVGTFGTPGSKNGQFVGCASVVFAGGYYLALDPGNHRVQRFTTSRTFDGKFGGAYLGLPRVLCTDGAYVYVADAGDSTVEKWTPSGTRVAAWGIDANPAAISWNPVLGRIVVGDSSGGIRQYTTAGAGVGAPWDAGGAAYGIGIDAGGYYWIADNVAHLLRKYTDDGSLLATYGGAGAGTGQFNQPTGVVCAGGEVYVADYANDRVCVWASVTRTETVPADTETTVPATSNPRLFGGCLLVRATPRT